VRFWPDAQRPFALGDALMANNSTCTLGRGLRGPCLQSGDEATVVQGTKIVINRQKRYRPSGSVHDPCAECVCPDWANSVVPLARVMNAVAVVSPARMDRGCMGLFQADDDRIMARLRKTGVRTSAFCTSGSE